MPRLSWSPRINLVIQPSSSNVVYPWWNWESADIQLCPVKPVLSACDLCHGWLSFAVLAKESPPQGSLLPQRRLVSWGSNPSGDDDLQQGSFAWVWAFQPRQSAYLLKPACLVSSFYLLWSPPCDNHSSGSRFSCLFWEKDSRKLYKWWLKGVEKILWHRGLYPCQ